MSNSSNRTKEYETVHHIVSRIAHRVRFLQEKSERNDLVEMIRRAADFTGIKLLGWCVMNNHFHILAFLPTPPDALPVDETIRRYGVLKGAVAAENLKKRLAALEMCPENGSAEAEKLVASIKKRMYSIGSFMKIVKQWFSEEYNRRTGHRGTLWEGAYFDRIVAYEQKHIARCLGYIHLNPIRAAVCDTFDGYEWSSYPAFKRGDKTAVAGMRFVYGDVDEDGRELSLDDIATIHEDVLENLLEEEKLRRAEEIALKRMHGYEMPDDPLTSEALITQSMVQLEQARKASIELEKQIGNGEASGRRRQNAEQRIMNMLKSSPGMEAMALAQSLGLSHSTVYRHLAKMAEKGLAERCANGWRTKILK